MAVRGAAMRGQATTEAALGILVITTVIVYGIHFSEVSILSLKVEEASASALWDTTAERMHQLTSANPDFTPKTAAVNAAGPEASARYFDFDGRASKQRPTPLTVQVFTQAGPIAVNCVEEGALPLLTLPPPLPAVFNNTMQGGMSCWAQSQFSVIPGRFTRNFLQGQPFRAQQGALWGYPICAPERADNGGTCNGRLVIALGDWGLTDGVESLNCDSTPPNTPCANTGYYLMAKSLFDTASVLPNPAAGRELWTLLSPAGLTGPANDTVENEFFMAAVGEDFTTPYQKENPSGDHPNTTANPYIVTPGGDATSGVLQVYEAAANQREPCAFGLPCDPRTWPAYQ